MNQAQIDRIQQDWLLLQAVATCLHVGCGQKRIDWAVNSDPNPDRAAWRDNDWDIHETPAAAGAFNSVVSSHVIPSLKDPALAFLEMARILAPGGKMAHIIPDWRYAPQRHDVRFLWLYQHHGWYGPRPFETWFHENVTLPYPGLFIDIVIESFIEFDFSFHFTATRTDKPFDYDLSQFKKVGIR